MSDFSKFMKGNKKEKENGFYPATNSLMDENGKPLMWEFRHLSSVEDEEIRESCTVDIPAGKSGTYRQKLMSGKYIKKLIAACVVVPDLFNSQLQDSYGVKTPEDLLMAMVDNPGEYNRLAVYVQEFQGFTSFDERVEEAKN